MNQLESGTKVLGVISVLVIGILLVTAILAFMYGEVCEEQLTQNGNIVPVCRRMQGRDLPVLAGAALFLLALGTFFPEVGAFGFSIKTHVAEARTSADNAKAASESATRAAALAEAAEQSVSRAEQLLTQLAISPQGAPSTTDVDGTIRELAAEYNAIRENLKPGPSRTDRMTNVIARMTVVVTARGPHDVEVNSWLSSEDRGLRLAAYAFLHTFPVPALTTLLAQSAIEEDTPFGQYWALRALRRQVSLDPRSLDLHTGRRLEELLVRVGPSTDRAYELTQILADQPDKLLGKKTGGERPPPSGS